MTGVAEMMKDWRPVGYCPNCECRICIQQTQELRKIAIFKLLSAIVPKLKNKGD